MMICTNGPLPGMGIAFPDVCNTPVGPAVVPIPYPNIVGHATAIPDQFNFMIMGFPVHNMAAMFPMSQGDEIAVLGGEMSGTVMGPGSYIGTIADQLLVGGMPAVTVACPIMGNGINAFGVSMTPTQVIVDVL